MDNYPITAETWISQRTYNKVVAETPDLLKAINIKEFLVPGGKYYSPENFADYQPGTGFTYSNLGFNLIGSLVEVISGERFDKYTIRHIFTPLQMDASFDPADIKNWNISETCFRWGFYSHLKQVFHLCSALARRVHFLLLSGASLEEVT